MVLSISPKKGKHFCIQKHRIAREKKNTVGETKEDKKSIGDP
jgi:hypothetical protein